MDQVQYFDFLPAESKVSTLAEFIFAHSSSLILPMSPVATSPLYFSQETNTIPASVHGHTYRALLPIFGGIGVSSSRNFSRTQYPDPTSYQKIFPLIVIDASVDFDISSQPDLRMSIQQEQQYCLPLQYRPYPQLFHSL